MTRTRFLLLLLPLVAVVVGHAVTPVNSAREIKPDQTGEFVSLSGTAAEFKAPRNNREPYSFWLTDKAGVRIRVCAWPDILQSVPQWEQLATSGTQVSLTAEVADYNGQLELHIQDGTEVTVRGTQAGAEASTSSLDARTTPASQASSTTTGGLPIQTLR